MTIARQIVALDKILNDERPEFSPFDRDGHHELQRDPAAAGLVDTLPAQLLENPSMVLKLALQTLRVQRAELQPRLLEASFVATLPGERPVGALPTSQVVREMLAAATTEVIALGYEISHAEVLRLLRDAATRGCRVVLVGDRDRVDPALLLRDWPEDNLPALYLDAPRAGAAAYAKMHCKSILVDELDLLITSANFTFHGLEGNIEFGVRLRGAPAADARKVFTHMLSSGLLSLHDWGPHRA